MKDKKILILSIIGVLLLASIGIAVSYAYFNASVSGNPTTNNVVTYEVVISAPNADLKLKPGLTANVTIYTQERSGVLAVANKALRFTPTKETVGKDMKIVDCKGKNKVWTLNDKTLTAHAVTIGQTDGVHTEIIKGIKKGQKIVTEIIVNTPEEEEDAQQSQGLISGPGPRGKKR